MRGAAKEKASRTRRKWAGLNMQERAVFDQPESDLQPHHPSSNTAAMLTLLIKLNYSLSASGYSRNTARATVTNTRWGPVHLNATSSPVNKNTLNTVKGVH